MKSNKLTKYFFKHNQQTLNKKEKIVNETNVNETKHSKF